MSYARRKFTAQDSKYKARIDEQLISAEEMLERLGNSREKNIAITKIDEAMMWASAAIAASEEVPNG